MLQLAETKPVREFDEGATWDYQRVLEVHEDIESKWVPQDIPGAPHALTSPQGVIDARKAAAGNPVAADIAGQYSEWRNTVTRRETDNAARLEGLLWAARATKRLLVRAPEDRALNAAQQAIGVALAQQWRLRPDRVPTTALEAREFAAEHCRNYRAMPREWREL